MSDKLLVALSPDSSAVKVAQMAFELSKTLGLTGLAVAIETHKGPATLEHILPNVRVNYPALDALEEFSLGDALEGYISKAPSVADGILHSVRELKPALLVMGTQGREGLSRMLEGSVAEGVLKRCPVPVLLLRKGVAVDLNRLEHVLVSVESDPGSERALEGAVKICQQTGARLTLLHVLVGSAMTYGVVYGGYPPTEAQNNFAQWRIRGVGLLERLETAARNLGGAELQLETALLETFDTSVSSKILTYACEHAVDLLTMSTSSKSGLDRLFLGSVAEGVIHHADLPVLLVGPAAQRNTVSAALEPTRVDQDIQTRSR